MAQQCHGWSSTHHRRCNRMTSTGFCHQHKECKVGNCGQHPPSATQTQNFPPENSLVESSYPSLDENAAQKFSPDNATDRPHNSLKHIVGALIDFARSLLSDPWRNILPANAFFAKKFTEVLYKNLQWLCHYTRTHCNNMANPYLCYSIAALFFGQLMSLMIHFVVACSDGQETRALVLAVRYFRGRFIQFNADLSKRVNDQVHTDGSRLNVMTMQPILDNTLQTFFHRAENMLLHYERELQMASDQTFSQMLGVFHLAVNLVVPQQLLTRVAPRGWLTLRRDDSEHLQHLVQNMTAVAQTMVTNAGVDLDEPNWFVDFASGNELYREVVQEAYEFTVENMNDMTGTFLNQIEEERLKIADRQSPVRLELACLLFLGVLLWLLGKAARKERPFLS